MGGRLYKFKYKRVQLLLISFSVALGVFGFVMSGHAGFWNFLGGLTIGLLLTLISWILYIPIYFFGYLVSSLLIPLLIWVANYNNFLMQPGIVVGWQVVRDLANMFFIVLMLLVAFGTLFNIETYQYKKLLPKLVIAAVLVNFSKMIIGILIDFSQVIMLTFVNAFEDVAAGNLIFAIGLDKIIAMSSSLSGLGGGIAMQLSLLGALILGIIMLVVTTAVLLVITVYLVARVIMLWMAIVLSPLLFVMPLIPAGQKFSSQIWDMVSKYLITGPLLGFFLWLSFYIMGATTERGMSAGFDVGLFGGAEKSFNAFFSKFGTIDSLLNFILVIGLLMASLMMASQMGVAGSKLAGDLAGKIKGGMAATAKWAAMSPWALTKYADRKLAAATGFAPITSTKQFIEGVKERMAWNEQKDKLEAQSRGGDILRKEGGGIKSILFGIGAGRDAADMMLAGGFLNHKGFANIRDRGFRGGRWEKIEKDKQDEQKKVEFLKVKKAMGDPLAVYDLGLEDEIKQNTQEKEDKEKELRDLPKVAADKEKAYYNAVKVHGQTSTQADIAEKEWFTAQQAVDDENSTHRLQHEIDEHTQKIATANQVLGQPLEDRKAAAINKYKDKAEQNREDALNLKEGKLTKSEVNSKAGEFLRVNDSLDKISQALNKESGKAGKDRNNVLLAQLDKDSKRETAKLNELKQALATDKKGNLIKDKDGNYQANAGYKIKDKKQLDNREKMADKLTQEADHYDLFAGQAKQKWDRGKEAINQKAIDRLITSKLSRVKDLSVEQVKYQAPQTFYADQARRSLVAEEEKKITSDNWEEQLAAMQDALKEGDRYKFEANFKAAAKRGNENEIMDQLGFLNAYRGKEDDVTPAPWKGQGMEAFRKHYLTGKLKMKEQDSIAMMDDVGYIGEGVGHWSIARGYGIRGGRRYAKEWGDQQNEVYAEQSKLDGRKLFRTLNRLGHGGEVPQLDGTRDYQLEPYAIRRFLTSFEDIKRHISGKEYSKSAAEHIAKSPVAIAQLEAAAQLLSGKMRESFDQMVNMIKEYGAQSEEYKQMGHQMDVENIMGGIDFTSHFHSY